MKKADTQFKKLGNPIERHNEHKARPLNSSKQEKRLWEQFG